MLFFNKNQAMLNAKEKQRSISILNFLVRNDVDFSQEIIIKLNNISYDFSFGNNYLTIIPLNVGGIITNYLITGNNNGKLSLELTQAQIQAISINDSNSREFRIRRNVSGKLVDLAVGKLKIETYPISTSDLESNTMKYKHTIGEGNNFDITVNADNIVVTDVIDVNSGLSTRSGVEITYNGNTANINLFFDRSVDVIYSSFNN